MNAIVNNAALKASFPVRRQDFGFADVPHYWAGGDVGLTHFFTSMSVLFPEGEMFFVESIRALRNHPMLKDNAQMQKEISAFIGQEAMHSKEHAAFNASAKSYGHDTDTLERWTRKVINIKRLFGKQTSMLDLAATVALEHYTAVLASSLLSRADMQANFTDPTMYKLWMWHAVEENEHKAVAYDIYKTVYGEGAQAYMTRSFAMVVATLLLFITQNYFMARLMRDDGKLAPQHWVSALSTLYHPRKGFISKLVPELLGFFRPDFHPNDYDTDALLATWKNKLGFSSAA